MKVYLVEEYSPEIKFENNSVIVALTPLACYQLDKAGIIYSIIENYYDETNLLAHEDEYNKSQIQWIDKLDEFLQETIPELQELDLKLGTVYYYFFKTNVIDPIYIKCYTLKKLLEATKPTSITYISRALKETSLDFTLLDAHKSYYSQVVAVLCKKNNIPLSSVFLEEGKTKQNIKMGMKSVSGDKNLTAKVKGALVKSGIIRRAYYWVQFAYRYLRSRPVRQSNQSKMNIFLVKLPHITANFIIDSLIKGYSIYLLSDDSIVKYSCFGTKIYLNLRAENSRTMMPDNSIWENAANLLKSHDIIKSINEKCQLDVSEIVLPKLRYFITNICPEIVGYFNVFTGFYKKSRINFVVTPHEWPPIEFAAIAAANHGNRAASVHIQHGDSIFADFTWNIIELLHFNYYITSNKEIKEYFVLQCKANNIPTKIYGSQDRLLNIKRINYLRETGKVNIKRNRIIYLPNIFFIDQYRLDGAMYPATWYHEFQKSLLRYLASRTEYTFIWKGFPQYKAMYNPIPDFIRDSHFSNIEIATNAFTEHLLSADRVICDFPSTGFYEAIVAVYLPYLCTIEL